MKSEREKESIRKKTADLTRKVYLKQHKNFTKSPVMFERFLKMVSDPTYFHLTKKDFEGKHVLDAGCGNTGYLQIALSRFGAGKITCLDIGEEWKKPLKKTLKNFGLPLNTFDFVTGDTDKLPFPDNHFDIVLSHGVLMHLNDMEQVEQAWRELARVTKPGGYLYVLLGCPGGLLEKEVIPAIRRYYRADKKFKEFIDTQTPETWVSIFKAVAEGMEKHTHESFNYRMVAPLFDLDFCTWVQNVIQAPVRLITELDEKYAFKMYRKFGFEKPKRCRRYVERKNIRKFFAPLHFDSTIPFSQLLYGPGNLEYIARKK